jgi:hypothetical protein
VAPTPTNRIRIRHRQTEWEPNKKGEGKKEIRNLVPRSCISDRSLLQKPYHTTGTGALDLERGYGGCLKEAFIGYWIGSHSESVVPLYQNDDFRFSGT